MTRGNELPCQKGPKPRPLRTAVIGVGYFGRYHAEKYSSLEDSELVAVVDTDLPRAKAIAELHGGAALGNYRDLFDKVDAVSVVTPSTTHHEIARDFLGHGIHVLLEKPIASTLEEADDLIQIADSKGVTLQIGHQERIFTSSLNLTQFIDAPLKILCQRKGPCGERNLDCSVITDLMIHDIDFIQNLIHQPIAALSATSGFSQSMSLDEATVNLSYSDGSQARLVATRQSSIRQRTARIIQPREVIDVDFLKRTCYHSRLGPLTPLNPNGPEKGLAHTANDELAHTIASFIKSAQTGARAIVTGEEGRQALEMALLIEEALTHQFKAVSAR